MGGEKSSHHYQNTLLDFKMGTIGGLFANWALAVKA
jgi:hypothetical protein